MTFRACLVACAVALAVPASAPAQSQTTPPQATPTPTPPQAVFKAGVELVRLDVRVLDDEGLPVKDLRQDEVQVSEGGARRPVVLFQHIAQSAGTYLEVARRTIGAEVSTNQGSPRGHLYLFVFDQNHITAGNEQRARQAVERFVRTRVKPGDRVALYALPGPGPQLPLTSNTSLVLAELARIRGGLDREGMALGATMSVFEAVQIARGDPAFLQRFLNRVAASAGGGGDIRGVEGGAGTGAASATSTGSDTVRVAMENAKTIVARADTEAHTFLLTFSDVIRELARIEGRKSIILVSEGFFTDNLTTDVERVAAAAAEAYAVIYALDINRRGVDVNASEPTGASSAQEVQSRLDSLSTLAAETSGEVLLDAGSRMDEALNRIADSSQDYYIIGFEPPARALADRQQYRRVSIKVTRPGARVASRTGYALRDAQNPADRRRAIDAALAAPFPQQGLPLEMTTYVLRGSSPGMQRVVMSLRADLPVADKDGQKPADLVFVARSVSDGRVVASGTDVIPLPRSAAAGRTVAQGHYRVQFDTPSGEYVMRVAVREPGGSTGTVDRRFEVRPLDGVDITASDLIIGRRTDALPVRARCYVGEGMSGALEVYARNPVDLESVDVTVDLVPINGDTAARSMKADLLEIRRVGNGGGRTAQIVMPLDGVPPGEYVARATLRARGESVTELIRQVEIAAGAPPAAAPVPPPERVTPAMILAGDVARRFVASLEASAGDEPLKTAASQAALGAWPVVIRVLGDQPGSRPFAYHALRGLALFAAERYDQAAGALEAALAVDPASAPTAFYLGWVRSSAGQDSEALTAWRNAVLHDPRLISAYLALADTYTRLGHPELAGQTLKEGVRLNPASLELQARLAEVDRK